MWLSQACFTGCVITRTIAHITIDSTAGVLQKQMLLLSGAQKNISHFIRFCCSETLSVSPILLNITKLVRSNLIIVRVSVNKSWEIWINKSLDSIRGWWNNNKTNPHVIILLAIWEGNLRITTWFCSQRASNDAKYVSMAWNYPVYFMWSLTSESSKIFNIV